MLTNIQRGAILMMLNKVQQKLNKFGGVCGMVHGMTDSALLENIIESKGIKYYFLAEKIKMSYQSLRSKIDNKHEFKQSEIENICEALGISGNLQLKNDIFFAKFVEDNSTNEELSNVTEVTQ